MATSIPSYKKKQINLQQLSIQTINQSNQQQLSQPFSFQSPAQNQQSIDCASCQLKASLNIQKLNSKCLKHSLSQKMQAQLNFNRQSPIHEQNKRYSLNPESIHKRGNNKANVKDLIDVSLSNLKMLNNRKQQIVESQKQEVIKITEQIIEISKIILKYYKELDNSVVYNQQSIDITINVNDQLKHLEDQNSLHLENQYLKFNDQINQFTKNVFTLNNKLIFYIENNENVDKEQIESDLNFIEEVNDKIYRNKLFIDEDLEKIRNQNLYTNLLIQAKTIENLIDEIQNN